MNEETLFQDALAKPPAERALFLDEACGDEARAPRRRRDAIGYARSLDGVRRAAAGRSGGDP